MREQFAIAEGQRGTFTATFKRFGSKSGFKWPIKTILLVDVKDKSGKISADHLWFTCGKQFKALDLKEGDRIQFVGRITPYIKGYQGNRDFDSFDDEPAPIERDYRISFPTKIIKLLPDQKIALDNLPLFASLSEK